MCCVIPPASPATTLVFLIASSSEVLPWSTWPMTVITGGRGFNSSSLSSTESITSSTSESDTRTILCPNSSTISSAVSASIDWFCVTINPLCISALTTSATRSAIRLESSCTTIDSGTCTSRTIFSRDSTPPIAFRRARSCLRFIAARDRCRPPSPPESAWFRVNLPTRRPSFLEPLPLLSRRFSRSRSDFRGVAAGLAAARGADASKGAAGAPPGSAA